MKLLSISLLFLIILQMSPCLSSAEETNWIPIVFFTPETQIGGGIVLAKSLWESSPGKLSSLRFIGFYTQNKQAEIEFTPTFYFSNGKVKISSEIKFNDFPDRFFGIGNNSLLSDEESFIETKLQALMRLSANIFSNIYLQIAIDRQEHNLREVEAGALLDALVPATTSERKFGLLGYGGSLIWDSRDFPRFPSEGQYHEMSIWKYQSLPGELHSFLLYSLDFRFFHKLSKNQVIAFQLEEESIDGLQVPFQSLPTLGGSRRLRGFFKGRFRDKHLLFSQIEYRLRIQRFAFMLFASSGRVAENFSDFNLSGNLSSSWHSSWGGGIHFFLIPKDLTSLTLDVGTSVDGTSFYLTVDQAF